MKAILDKQRTFFDEGHTRPVSFRVRSLQRLRDAIEANEARIFDALKRDLNKSTFDAYVSEVGPCLAEIRLMIRNLKKWAGPKRLGGSVLFPLSSASVVCEPLGQTLIICPWNYPFRLSIMPLIASLAAGNCTILKPSEVSVHTEKVIADMIGEYIDDSIISVVRGGPEVCTELLSERFDHILYTGNEHVAKIVATAAARHLTPVTLELGGKCPCIVDKSCDLAKTAKRIAWGKFLNAGQTCVAPDHLFIDKKLKNELVDEIKKAVTDFYGADPELSDDYGRIINERHFDRVTGLLNEGEILHGGEHNREKLYVAPTLMQHCLEDARISNEEIFGPILPVVEFDEVAEAIAAVNRKPKPLALYIFSQDKSVQREIVNRTSSGAVCINDANVHLSRADLPFGGVGNSGHGRYHGRAGFETFSNKKSLFRQTSLFDIPKRFPPTDALGLKMIRQLVK